MNEGIQFNGKNDSVVAVFIQEDRIQIEVKAKDEEEPTVLAFSKETWGRVLSIYSMLAGGKTNEETLEFLRSGAGYKIGVIIEDLGDNYTHDGNTQTDEQ